MFMNDVMTCEGCGTTGEPLGGTNKCSDCVGVDIHNYRALHDGRMKIREYHSRVDPAPVPRGNSAIAVTPNGGF